MTGRFLAAAASGALLVASGLGSAHASGIVDGEVLVTRHDGITDDLLTAGLGKTGLQSPLAPGFADPINPTTAELRRLAIYSNYRALLDMTQGGGYGVLYGPNVTADGTPTADEGLIPGVEYIAYAGGHFRRDRITMLVQIPDGFDPAMPCIVTAPSSGSRGVYGAIATSGEWGLKNGCAVAYSDKGTGIGAHDLEDDTVNLITGERADANLAGSDSNFTARLSDRQQQAYNAETPDRFAVKHAHSESNPEADWGHHVLRSIEFAFHALRLEFPAEHLTPDNTIVIASSVSNGGGASLRAAERDHRGLIDGVAVSEPNVNPRPGGHFAIVQGAGAPFTEHSRSLYDYTTLLNLYQGCANRAASNAAAPFNLTPPMLGENRCASLHEQGLLTTTTMAEQAEEAQAIINDYGILPEQNVVQPSHHWAFVPQAIAVTYANAYARASVADRLCGYSFGATSGNPLLSNPADPTAGQPMPLSAAVEAALFGVGNGIPPTGGVNLINDDSLGGPREDRVSTSPASGRQDQNLDGARCLRNLAARLLGHRDDGDSRTRLQARRIQQGVRAIEASGDLDGLPALIVTGRSDAILPPNHASRAYVGLNQLKEGGQSGLSYVEVTNAQHLDAFNAFAGFDSRFIPLHHYFVQALDLMLDHLRNGTPLPPSQVVHTTPRGGAPGAAPPISEATHLPPIAMSPAAGDEITFAAGELRIPD